MTTHTEGRLTVRRSKISDTTLLETADDDFQHIANIADHEVARRLAAAWNASLGVPLDTLERLDVGRLVAAARAALAVHDMLRAALGE